MLDEDAVREKLQKIDVAWSVIGGVTLNRIYDFADFNEGLIFVNNVGQVADKLDHHPDVKLSYGKVELNVKTHSVGGLTEKDFEFARKIDSIGN